MKYSHSVHGIFCCYFLRPNPNLWLTPLPRNHRLCNLNSSYAIALFFQLRYISIFCKHKRQYFVAALLREKTDFVTHFVPRYPDLSTSSLRCRGHNCNWFDRSKPNWNLILFPKTINWRCGGYSCKIFCKWHILFLFYNKFSFYLYSIS